MPRFIISNEARRHGIERPASSHEVNVMLGLREKEKLPREGMPPRELQGIRVWVTPLPGRPKGSRWKRSTHRVLAECPDCRQVVSVGRLAQHECHKKPRKRRVRQCADCGAYGERTGHMECPFPQDHA